MRQFGFELVVGGAYGAPVPRNGTFFEGNYLGFYAVVALFVAVRSGRKLPVAAALACLAYSQSTGAVVGLAAGIAASAIFMANARWRFRIMVTALVTVAGLLMVAPARGFMLYQIQKLGGGSAQNADVTASADVRSTKADIAFRMIEHHPVVGVGPGRFGVWFQQYIGDAQLPVSYFTGKSRFIVENAYLQVGAELGLLGLAFLALVLWFSFRQATTVDPLTVAIVAAVAVMLNATPSWTTLTIWYSLAFVAALAFQKAAPRAPWHQGIFVARTSD
nr:O-antigen ligase family protein [Flexivirga aerilata]